nr:hypothetical protein [Candidatus Sigynarchaeota archaeon]
MVSLSPSELVDICSDYGCLIGPAHAFTPFKSVFRQGKFDSLAYAYGSQAKNVHFIELGLSANTDYADRIKELHRVTFMSNSDAHSPSPVSLGREFNTFLADSPSFEEIDLAIRREGGRTFTRNVGFDPRLGKYNVLFCNACRRRVLVTKLDASSGDIASIMAPPRIEGEFIHVQVLSETDHLQYRTNVTKGKIACPACAREGKKSKIKLGVSDRVVLMSDTPVGVHPGHRPPYINIVPLMEMLRVAIGVSTPASKVVDTIYTDLVGKHGPEIDILLIADVSKL